MLQKGETFMKQRKSVGLFILVIVLLLALMMLYRGSYYRTRDKIAEAEVKSNEVEVGYYIKDADGYVTVYEADQKTVYEYTSIRVSDLPDKVQEQLKSGMKVLSPGQVYGFLENYSS